MDARTARSPEKLFTPDFRATPWWWERTPRPDLGQPEVPKAADAVVVGSGYTGLNAALELARAGRETVVLDAEDAGWGCSTRNGGQVGTSIKPPFAELCRRYGEETARGIVRTGQTSLAWLGDFVRAEAIDCDFRVVGRFHAAHSPRHFDALTRALAKQTPGLEVEARLVPRAEQRSEIGSDAYHGGVVYARHASLDPARYHAGLLERVQAAGAAVVPRCPATAVTREGQGFAVETPRGTVRAADVVLATNGYTGGLLPWLRRRVIPIGSYIIATEPLAPEQIDRLIPRDRVISDSRRVVYYYRASPDRRRILFGGRVSAAETDPRRSAPRLHAEMARIFPELEKTRVSHSWVGFVAYTFDTLPHVGRHDGIHYAAGYCGSGVGMASYLGMRLGRHAAGLEDEPTPLARATFPTRPLYHGRPWFLAPTVELYRWLDRLKI